MSFRMSGILSKKKEQYNNEERRRIRIMNRKKTPLTIYLFTFIREDICICL